MSLTPRQIIKSAMRSLGAIASGDDPTADEMNDALEALNRVKRAWFGTFIGTRLGPKALTGASGQAENGGEYQIPPGPFTLTAPLNPKNGSRFGVVDANLIWGATPLTIVRNGQLINGAAANYVISTAGQNTRFWFRADTGNWVIESDYANLDTPTEFPDSVVAYVPFFLAELFASELGADVPANVQAGVIEGRLAFARAFARRGRNQLDAPIGVPVAQPQRGQ